MIFPGLGPRERSSALRPRTCAPRMQPHFLGPTITTLQLINGVSVGLLFSETSHDCLAHGPQYLHLVVAVFILNCVEDLR